MEQQYTSQIHNWINLLILLVVQALLDLFTEHKILFCMAACHMTFHHNHDDKYSGELSFQFGPSTSSTVEPS